MTIPLKVIIDLFKKIFGKQRRCTHCRAMNPDEKQWKPCCKRYKGSYFYYECCECGRTNSIFF